MTLQDWLDVYTAQGDAAQRCAWVKRAWRAMRPVVEQFIVQRNAGVEVTGNQLIDGLKAAAVANEIKPGGKRWKQEFAKLVAIIGDQRELFPAVSADERGVVLVAADLVEEQRYAEAIALLREQAPNVFGRKCPACSQPVGRRCREIGMSFREAVKPGTLSPQAAALVAAGEPKYPAALIVPHEARVA